MNESRDSRLVMLLFTKSTTSRLARQKHSLCGLYNMVRVLYDFCSGNHNNVATHHNIYIQSSTTARYADDVATSRGVSRLFILCAVQKS